MPVEVARRVVRAARALTNRALHPARRRRAIETVRGFRPKKVMVLCHGNICRSPFAAALLARELRAAGLDTVVESAGFVGPDRPSPAFALSVAREFGVDLEPHRSRVVLPHVIQGTDLFVVMSAEQARDLSWRGMSPQSRVVVLGDFDPVAADARAILDPWNCDEAVFRESYSRIERCVRDMTRAIRGSQAP
jgi:protein-tyrosine phosphatase